MSLAPKGSVIPGLLTVLLALSGMGGTPAIGMGQDIVPVRSEVDIPADTTLVSDLLAMVPSRMEADGVPGLNVLILRRGQVAWRASFGWADPEGERPMELDAVFRVESISKPVTAWGVMRLAQDGVLDLDAPVQEQIRRHTLPPGIPSLTPRQLLSHTAGVGLGDYTDRHPPDGPRPTLEESLAGELSMVGDPGEAFSYSDTGFNLLELLVQDVTGHDFAEWMDRTVLDPLGMLEAGYDWDPGTRARVPTAHSLRGQSVEPYVYPGRASGGLFATLDDIGRFARAGSPPATSGPGAVEDRPGVLADSSVALLHTPVVRPRGLYGIVAEGYGLGHFTEVLSDGRRAVWHGGQGHGWMTHFHLIPQTGDGIVLLANSQRAWPLFAHVLRAWSGSLGVDPVRMARITWAAPLAWTVIAVLLAGALALTIGVLRRLGSGGRAVRGIPARSVAIRLLALAAGLALLGGVMWAATQEYLFLFSILPSTTGRLGLATAFFAAALIVWAAIAGRSVRQRPQDPSPIPGPAASGSSGTVLVVLAAIVSSVAEPARAQEALVQLEGDWMPASEVTRSLSGPATEAQVRIVRGSALMPLAFRQGGVLMVPRISGSRVGVMPRPIDPAEPVWVEALYDLDLELLAQVALSDRTRATVILAPGIASDFRGRELDHLTLQGAVLLTRSTDAGPSWGGGLSVTNAFGEVRVVPLAAVQWETDRLRVDLLAPVEGRVLWMAGEQIGFGVQASIDGNVYGLGREGTLQGGRVRYSLADGGPAVQYDLGQRLRLSASAGLSFVRRLEVEDVNGVQVEDAALSRGWRIGLGISWLLEGTDD